MAWSPSIVGVVIGWGLARIRIRSLGLSELIISTEVNPAVSVRAKKLKTECIQGGVGQSVVIADWAASLGLSLPNISFLVREDQL